MFDKDLSVLGCRKDEISRSLSIVEHGLAKKQLNNSTSLLKLVTNLFLPKIGGLKGIFLLLWKVFSSAQFVLGLVDESLGSERIENL